MITNDKGSVRLGICGLGQMGKAHARYIQEGRIPGLELTAVCDTHADHLEAFEGIAQFTEADRMISSGEIEAILIVTPHYFHTTIGVEALNAGLHVLVEKPISAHKADCEKLIAAHRNPKQVFAAMFNQRLDPHYRRIRDFVKGGELGTIRRINWITTDWYRTEAYYASGGWRATWAGEGGGVLLNQCPHNLDLYQWIFGQPCRVHGFCKFGRYHRIEVEDDVTAYFEHSDGANAAFVATTGEAPGTNRLEVVGEQGKLVLEKGKLAYARNDVPMSHFSRTAQESFARPQVESIEVPLPADRGEQHIGILKNFANAIRSGEELVSPAHEGIHSVELANAILMSSLAKETVELPISSVRYGRILQDLINYSRFNKPVVNRVSSEEDFARSF